MKFIQCRKSFRKWVNQDIIDSMRIIDEARAIARCSDLDADWNTYRSLRNKCSK